jgi:hypothetical protein
MAARLAELNAMRGVDEAVDALTQLIGVSDPVTAVSNRRPGEFTLKTDVLKGFPSIDPIWGERSDSFGSVFSGGLPVVDGLLSTSGGMSIVLVSLTSAELVFATSFTPSSGRYVWDPTRSESGSSSRVGFDFAVRVDPSLGGFVSCSRSRVWSERTKGDLGSFVEVLLTGEVLRS